MQPVEPKLMTAKEAREKIDKGEDEKSFAIWCNVAKEINQAIENGENNYCKEGSLPESVIRKLQNLGYRVEEGSQYNQSYFMVKW